MTAFEIDNNTLLVEENRSLLGHTNVLMMLLTVLTLR